MRSGPAKELVVRTAWVAPYFPLRSLSHLQLRKPMTRTRHKEAGPLVFPTRAAWALDLRWPGWQREKQGTTPVRTQVPQDLASKAARPVEGVPTCPGPQAGRGQVPCYARPGEATRNSASGLLAPGME